MWLTSNWLIGSNGLAYQSKKQCSKYEQQFDDHAPQFTAQHSYV